MKWAFLPALPVFSRGVKLWEGEKGVILCLSKISLFATVLSWLSEIGDSGTHSLDSSWKTCSAGCVYKLLAGKYWLLEVD